MSFFIDRITDTQATQAHVVTIVFDGTMSESRFFFDTLSEAQTHVRLAEKMGAIGVEDFVTISPVTVPVGGEA